MKKSMLKFACIFIIVMYCIAPLSAIDLIQDDNNNKYINQEDNDKDMAVKDANININDDENHRIRNDENKSIIYDESNSAGNDEALNLDESNIEIENSKENLSEGRKQPNIRMHIDDVEKGQVPVLEVYADKDLIALDLLAYCPDFKVILKYYEFDFHDGYGECYLSQEKYLDPGNYTVTIDYAGTNLYYPQKVSTTFEVYKKGSDPNLGIKVDDINLGEQATADITAHQKLNGTVYVKVDGYTSEYPVMMNDGHAQFTFDDTLEAGYYTASVRYDGDDRFKASESSTSFKVTKAIDPNLKIKVNDIVEGEKAEVDISANETLTGDVKVKLNNSDIVYSAAIVEGNGKMFIKDLAPGDYLATVSFAGDDTFKASESSTTFKVNKVLVDPNLDIKVDDISEGEKAVAVVSANETLNGDANIKLNHSNAVYPIKIVNGSATVTIDDDLAPGDYLATVSYYGDDTFKASENSTTFKVNKFLVDPNLTINVNDITEGEKAIVDISAIRVFNGKVQVKLNDSNVVYNATVLAGKGRVIIKDLAPGDYLATVSFAGNDTFKADMNTTTFKVNEKVPELVDPNLSIKVNNITEGEKAVAVVSANETLNGDANIKLNHSNAVYPIKIVNGSATVTIDDDLAPGDYLATVSYYGDDTFKASENSTTFNVKEKAPDLIDPNLDINVNNITYGDKATVTVTTDEGFTGNVDVKIGNTNYIVKVVNGKGTKSISGLKVGTYTAKATFKQTDVYKASTKTTKFTVKKATPKIIASSEVFSYFQKTKYYSVSLKDNKGKAMNGQEITLKVDGKTYSAKTNANGVATFKLTELTDMGIYKAVISYDGDENYNEASKNVLMIVSFPFEQT